jgi:hypothetical protein
VWLLCMPTNLLSSSFLISAKVAKCSSVIIRLNWSKEKVWAGVVATSDSRPTTTKTLLETLWGSLILREYVNRQFLKCVRMYTKSPFHTMFSWMSLIILKGNKREPFNSNFSCNCVETLRF